MEKRGLGRGLSVLIPNAMDERHESQVRDIPLAQIVPNPYQPRTLFDPLKHEELVASIRQHGVLQPVLVRRIGHERYQLVAGERRFRAAQTAELTSLPALVKEVDDREQLEIAIIENLQREDIGVIEAARAYRRMIDEFGMTQETVSQRVAKSRSSVANSLRLLNLPLEVLDSIERGEITEGHARALMMAEETADILSALKLVISRGLSVRETEKLAKGFRLAALDPLSNSFVPDDAQGAIAASSSDRSLVRNKISDPNEGALMDELQQMLKTKVLLRSASNGAGRIEIEFYSGEDLARILETILSIR